MLLEFSVRNFRSFRDEHTFSLVASQGKEHWNTHTAALPGDDDRRGLRSAVVYGPNASGKTNLLLALNAMKEVVVKSAVAGQRGDAIQPIDPFRLTKEHRSASTAFEVNFITDGVEYQYGFEATREQVIEEWLYAYPKGQARRWFTRTYNANHENGAFNPGDYLKGQRKQIWEATRPNALFLSTAVQLNNEQLAPIFDWFRSVAYLPGRRLGSAYTAETCEDEEQKQRILALLSAADVGIRDMFLEEEPVDFDQLPAGLVDVIAETGKKDQVEKALSRAIRFQHTEEADEDGLLDLEEESHGTQQLFGLAGPILDVLDDGRVLLVDEIDASLHPTMVEEVVSLFNDPATNPHGAQLLFNTHDVTLLNQDLLRRDQIWITEKFDDGASQLTPLLDFKPRKKTEALDKNYLEGRYGGLPLPRMKQKAEMIAHETR
jgi:AAA15 family ATPase/GTPase